jgi:hypothetical protein
MSLSRSVVRLAPEVIARLDQLVTRMRAAHPDRIYSRASLVRALLPAPITDFEQDAAQFEELARLAARPPRKQRKPASPTRAKGAAS